MGLLRRKCSQDWLTGVTCDLPCWLLHYLCLLEASKEGCKWRSRDHVLLRCCDLVNLSTWILSTWLWGCGNSCNFASVPPWFSTILTLNGRWTSGHNLRTIWTNSAFAFWYLLCGNFWWSAICCKLEPRNIASLPVSKIFQELEFNSLLTGEIRWPWRQ